MYLSRSVVLAVVCAAQAVVCAAAQPQVSGLTLKIPRVQTSVSIDGQPVEFTAWGTISSMAAGIFRLAVTVDLGNFRENLTPVMAAQLNRSDRCGERLSVERAVLAPSAPSALLTAYVHVERFTCVKAFGKEIVKRLVGGNGVVEVNLTPSVAENRIVLTAEVRKIDADGSLGEVLGSGSAGGSLRQKIAASIESAVQKSADFKSTLPAGMEKAVVIQTPLFADGGAGRLWLTIGGEARLSAEQFQGLAQGLSN
jgi:hypothetical protein